jgi:hypothetical protein
VAESSEIIELVDTLSVLRTEFGVDVTYARLWTAAAAGRIPATRSDRHWWVRRDDLPKVAEAFTRRACVELAKAAAPIEPVVAADPPPVKRRRSPRAA